MKTFELRPTSHPDVFRVTNREGNWTHYYHKPKDRYLRAVSFILDSGYAKGQRFYEYLKNGSKEDLERKLKAAGDRGDKVHQFIAKIFDTAGQVGRFTKVLAEDNVTEQELSDDEWDAILAFQHFWNAHQPKLIASEMTLFNLKHGYAGTLDALIRLTKACDVKTCKCNEFVGKIGLYDWKSGGGIYGNFGAQLAAYAAAENLKKFLGKKNRIEYTAILRIGTRHKTTGGYELQIYDQAESLVHWKEFVAAMQISDAEYKPFDAEKEIYDIPETLDLTVETEELNPPKKTPRRKKPKGRKSIAQHVNA